MYLGSLIFVVIIFIIIFVLSILLVIASDNLIRLPSGKPYTNLDNDISYLTFGVITTIFLIGIVLSLGVLIYYRSTFTSASSDTGIQPDAPISSSRTDLFAYLFMALCILGGLILLSLLWTTNSDAGNFLDIYSNSITKEQVSDITIAKNYIFDSLILDIVFLLFTLLIICLYSSGI
jgi:hypothetical protein